MKVLGKARYGVPQVPRGMLDKAYKYVLNNIFFKTSKVMLTPMMRKFWKDITLEFLSKPPSKLIGELKLEADFSDMAPQYKKLIDAAKKEKRLLPLHVNASFQFKNDYFYNADLNRRLNAQTKEVVQYIATVSVGYFPEMIKQSVHRKLFEMEKELKQSKGDPNVAHKIESELQVLKQNVKQDIEIALDKIHGSLEHEIGHYVQYSILPSEQTKRKEGYGDPENKVAYYTSPVEFGPTLQTIVRDFKGSYSYFLKNLRMMYRRSESSPNFIEGITPKIIETNVKLVTGEIDYDKMRNNSKFFDDHTYKGEFLLCLSRVPNDFMMELKKHKPSAYRKAVNYMHRNLKPEMQKLRDKMKP